VSEGDDDRQPLHLREAFAEATFRRPALRACSQAGLFNNLNDALAWGLVPLFLAANGEGPGRIGLVAGVYPGVWAATQVWTGHLSDRMELQAAGLVLLAVSGGAFAPAVAAAALVGLGTAFVYPTLIAAISDVVAPIERATVVGVYRFWRDMGYVVGGLVVGLTADAIDYGGAIALVAGLTAASGAWVAFDLPGRPGGRRRERLREEWRLDAAAGS
jgi:MFS family permease